MKNPFKNPLIGPIIIAFILELIFQGSLNIKYLELSGFRFFAPENIDNQKCLIWIENISEYYESIKVNLEFYEKFSCKADAFILDKSKEPKELNISRQDEYFISWDSFKDSSTGNGKIFLYRTDRIGILLTYSPDESGIPIKNINIFHTKGKGYVTLKDYQLKIRLRKGIYAFCIFIILLIFPSAKYSEKLQRKFLKKCLLRDEKAQNKFNIKYDLIIKNAINEYFSDILHGYSKVRFKKVIKYFHIFENWKEIPKFYRSLDESIDKFVQDFCGKYLRMIEEDL